MEEIRYFYGESSALKGTYKCIANLIQEDLDNFIDLEVPENEREDYEELLLSLSELKKFFLEEPDKESALEELVKCADSIKELEAKIGERRSLDDLLMTLLLLSGKIAFLLGNYQASDSFFKEAYGLAKGYFDKTSESGLAHLLLLLHRWRLRIPFNSGNDAQALSNAKKALDSALSIMEGKDSPELSRDLACLHIEVGYLEFQERNPKNAVKSYEEAFRLIRKEEPSWENFHVFSKIFDDSFEFASLLEIRSDFETALKFYTLAIESYTPVILDGLSVAFLPYLLTCFIHRAFCCREISDFKSEGESYLSAVKFIESLPKELKRNSIVLIKFASAYLGASFILFREEKMEEGFEHLKQSYEYAKKSIQNVASNKAIYKTYNYIRNIYEECAFLLNPT